MKIQFKNYTYFDGRPDKQVVSYGVSKNPDRYLNNNRFTKERVKRKDYLTNYDLEDKYDKYKFDENKFNTLIKDRRYEEAAQYAEQYHFSDPEVQKEHENDIISLRKNGRILGAIYSRIDNADDLKQIEFYDNVFVDGGLESINSSDYTKEFERIKNKIGMSLASSKLTETDYRTNNTIGIVFEPQKQYGIFGIDWLARDNPYTIDYFYETSGLTEQELKEAGVDVIKKDGSVELKFDKSNKYANRILYNVPTVKRIGDSGTLLGAGDHMPTVVAYNENGKFTAQSHINELKNFIDSAKQTKDKYFNKLDNIKDYTSIISKGLIDELAELENEELTDDEYDKRAKLVLSQLPQNIYSIGSGAYEMYSNNPNDLDTDETLVELNNQQRGEVMNIISATAPRNIHIDGMSSGGKIGALITIDAKEGREKDSGKPVTLRKRIQVFIPGFLTEEVQNKINEDTSTRAAQELNDLIDWGYSYRLKDGTSISINEKGEFVKGAGKLLGDKVIKKDEALREINKDMIITDAISNLRYQYSNIHGDLIKEEEYESMAKAISLGAISELYEGAIQRADTEGNVLLINNELFKVSDIFNKNFDISNMSFTTFKIIKDMYEMYDDIMYDLASYK